MCTPPAPGPPRHPRLAMTLFYMAISLGLVNVWMAWRRFLWADQFFMQARRGGSPLLWVVQRRARRCAALVLN